MGEGTECSMGDCCKSFEGGAVREGLFEDLDIRVVYDVLGS